MRKRVVLQHVNGIHQIIGVFDDTVHQVRDRIAFGDEIVRVYGKLASVNDRYVLYREVRSKE